MLIDIGKVEAVLPAGRAGARRGVHARQPAQGLRRVGGPHLPRAAGDRVAHPPEPGPQAVRARGARDRRRQRRDRRGGPRGRAPLEDRRPHQGAGAERQGLLHRPDGPAGAQRDERAARREDRHRRLVRRPRHLRGLRAAARRGSPAPRWSTRRRKAVRVVVPDYQLSLAIGKEGQNARLAARLTGCRIDIRSDAQAGDEAATPSPGVGRAPLRSGPPGRLGGRRPAARSRAAGLRSGARNIPAPPRARVRVAETSIPVRTCVGCRKRAPVTELLRVVVRVRGPGPGSAAAAPRPGASVHPTPECLHAAERRRAFPRALRLRAAHRWRPVRSGTHVLGSSSECRRARPGRASTPADHSRTGTRPVRTSRAGRPSDEPAVKSPR